MIDVIFNYANEVLLVKVQGSSVLFGSTTFGAKMADISGLRLDYSGTIREFPDLANDLEWRQKAISRFKDHIKILKTEDKITEYLIDELSTKGYKPKYKQIKGFRAVKI